MFTKIPTIFWAEVLIAFLGICLKNNSKKNEERIQHFNKDYPVSNPPSKQVLGKTYCNVRREDYKESET